MWPVSQDLNWGRRRTVAEPTGRRRQLGDDGPRGVRFDRWNATAGHRRGAKVLNTGGC